MTKEERLEKTSADFSSLTGQEQDYVLGIMQALFFAKQVVVPAEAEREALETIEKRNYGFQKIIS
jgi:hypothetical protein